MSLYVASGSAGLPEKIRRMDISRMSAGVSATGYLTLPMESILRVSGRRALPGWYNSMRTLSSLTPDPHRCALQVAIGGRAWFISSMLHQA